MRTQLLLGGKLNRQVRNDNYRNELLNDSKLKTDGKGVHDIDCYNIFHKADA